MLSLFKNWMRVSFQYVYVMQIYSNEAGTGEENNHLCTVQALQKIHIVLQYINI